MPISIRGAAFQSLLFLVGRTGDAPGGSEGPARAPLYFDVSYPTLPKTPAVNLLRLLRWDVVTFEMLASQVLVLPQLDRVGARAQVDRISHTWMRLDFKNTLLTSTMIGYGVWYNRACVECTFDGDWPALDDWAELCADRV